MVGGVYLSLEFDMSAVLTQVRRHDGMRRLGKRLERRCKSMAYSLLARFSRESQTVSPETLQNVHRVLLVRPNFRLGNAVIGARLIEAFASSRPDIAIDYLGTDTTSQLFKHMPLQRYYAHSRSFSWRVWALIRLILALRRNRYDLAIQVGEGSLTSWLFLQLCGASRLLGQSGRLQHTYDWLLDGTARHAYDLSGNIAQALGLTCQRLPWMIVTKDEASHVETLLPSATRGGVVGLFVGGHLDKRLPLNFWLSLLEALNESRERYLVMLGPEEEQHRSALIKACGTQGRILPLLPLRDFAAALTHVITLITPDTGPMHIASALGVPVVAVLNSDKSYKFVPHGIADKALYQPSAEDVMACLRRSPLLSSPGMRTEHMLDRKMLLH